MIVIWWTLTQKDRTLRVVGDDPALETLLASAPAIRLNVGERPVTIISPRAATALEQWLGADAAELATQGREVRAIIVPSGHGGTSEEATVVQLWQGRDIGLLRQWLSMRAEHWTAVGIEPVSASETRMAVLAEAAGFRRSVLQRLGRPVDDNRWPLVIWRDAAGQLAVCHCHTPQAVAEARLALGLKGKSPPVVAVVPTTPAPVRAEPAVAETENVGAYPRLGDMPVTEPSGTDPYGEVSETRSPLAPAPALPGDVAPVAPSSPAKTTSRPTSRPSRPARPPRTDVNTAAPKAEKDSESLFY
ncbi:hypothetical protein [Brevundimonas sp.]|uniref:hypothetical protein n=2 Tax=Brevundimonas sp. TaxID=1871086 RepID=UPI002FCB6C22